jgi:preprotein translocase subunit SecF
MILISVILIGAGWVGTFLQGGFNLGIDFQAGLSMRVAVSDSSVPEVRDALDAIGAQVQRVGREEEGEYSIRVGDDGMIEDFQQTMSSRILTTLSDQFGNVEHLETAYVGPRFSRDLTQQAVFLTVFALGLILLYIWFRFRFGYAISAITALVHDVLFMLGFIGAFQLEVTTATIAAVLTIIGYSLNDTIVIFDRVRENETLMRDSSIVAIADTSITQSLSRTLITSLTTLLAVAAIYAFATGSIQIFALNLIVGVVIGTYSSIFIASPALIALHQSATKRRKHKEMERYRRGSVVRENAPGEVAKAPPPVDVEAAKRAVAQQRAAKKKKR